MAKLKLKELALELGISDDDAKKIMTDSGRDAKYTRFTKASALFDEDIDFIKEKAASMNKKADSKAEANGGYFDGKYRIESDIFGLGVQYKF